GVPLGELTGGGPHAEQGAQQADQPADPDPGDEGAHHDAEGRAPGLRVDGAHDDVEVVVQAAADGDLGGRHLRVQPVDVLGGGDRGADAARVVEEAHVGEDHALLRVDLHARL